MTTTPLLGLPVLYENQYQKSVSINQAFSQLDYLIQMSVLSMALNSPPVSPTDQDKYVVGGSPTGAWIGQTNNIAIYQSINSSWTFITPKPGWLLWNIADSGIHIYSGGIWIVTPLDVNMIALDAMTGTGLTTKTAVNTWVTRTITAGYGVSVANGGGVLGNPTISISANGGNTFTLTPSVTTTVVTDALCTTTSLIFPKPTTQNAAADMDLMYIVEGTGSFTVHHVSNTNVDRTFKYVRM